MPIDDYADLIPKKEDKLSQVATPEVLSAGTVESPEVAFKPIEFSGVPKTKTVPDAESFLDKRDLSEGFVSDVKSAIAQESGQYINPFSLGETPRQVLDKAVASGFISPSFKPDEDMGAITPYWNGYKNSKDQGSSILRGAMSSIGSTIGSVAVGGAASMVPLPGSTIAGGIYGSIKGAEIQDAFFPPTDAERAQLAFDYDLPSTTLGRMIGEFLPSFLTLKPGLETGKELIKSALIASGIDIGFAAKQVYQGAELKPQEFLERLAFDVGTSIVTKPNRLGRYVFNREYRKDMAALDNSKEFLRTALGAKKGAETTAKAARVADEIEQGALLNENGVNIGSGELSDVSGLIALQSALERRNTSMMDRRRETEANISSNLASKMRQEGASPLYTQEKFDGQNQQAIQEAANLRDTAIAKGNQDGAAIFDRAFAEVQRIRSAAVNRVSDAETASLEANVVLNNAMSEFAEQSGIQTKATASTAARTRFQQLDQASADIAEQAYARIGKQGDSILTDFSNSYKGAVAAAKKYRSRSERIEGANLDPAIRRIIDNYGPTQKGSFRKFNIHTLRGEIVAINNAIRKAAADSMPLAALNEVRTAMEKDLDKLGEKSKLVREANAIYKDHIDKYVKSNGLNKPPSEFLDHYLNGSFEDHKQLRAASTNPNTGEISPAVFNEITNWTLNKLVGKFGVKPSAKALSDWYKNEDLSSVFEVFPEVQPRVKAVIEGISSAQKTVDDLLSQKKTAEANQREAFDYADTQLEYAQRQADQLVAGVSKSAQTTFDEFARSVQNTAASRFLGPTPVTAIENIFADRSRSPVKEFGALMQAAQGDAGAVEGIKNALREYIARNTAKYASVVAGKSLDATGEVTAKDLKLSVSKLNEELLPTSDIRQVMDMVLDPREVLALKTAREQTRAMLRKTSLTQGESSTAFNTVQDIILGEGLSGNAMSVLFRFARGVDPSKRSALTAGVESTVDLARKLWRGDAKTRVEELLVDFNSNPYVAAEMLRGLDQKSKPRVEAFLKAWTVAKGLNQTVKPLPFAPQNVYEEDLKNGTVTTDTKYGFKIVKTQQRKYRLFAADGTPVGIYDTPTEAEQKAVNQHMQNILKQK